MPVRVMLTERAIIRSIRQTRIMPSSMKGPRFDLTTSLSASLALTSQSELAKDICHAPSSRCEDATVTAQVLPCCVAEAFGATMRMPPDGSVEPNRMLSASTSYSIALCPSPSTFNQVTHHNLALCPRRLHSLYKTANALR